MIDIHCHILADVDDGPKSWDVAQEMCLMAVGDGIEHIVATPHANERYHYDREYLSGLLDHLRKLVGPAPRFSLGCDFHLSYENLQDVMIVPDRYCIEGTRYLLVELSNYSVPVQMDDCFANLREKGITPVITHPERNPIVQQAPQRVLKWVEQGCAVQVTASALTGFWGERAWRAAEWLLKRDAVHVLATDAHDTKRRTPVLSEARHVVAEEYSEEVAQALVDANPRAIVNGQPLPYFPDPVMKS
ncbi:MAG: CpsB/CapC family capsule biosynthesis tyrosine phosphatase [Terriglobales bacterium]